MSNITNQSDNEKLEVIDHLLTELSKKIHVEKSHLLNRLICKHVSYEDLEDFCDLHEGEYIKAKIEASERETVDFLSIFE